MRIFPILLHPFCWAIPSIIMLKTYLIKIISFHYFSFSFHIFSIYYRTKRQNFVLSLCIVRIVCVSRVRKYLMRLWKNDDYYFFFVKFPHQKYSISNVKISSLPFTSINIHSVDFYLNFTHSLGLSIEMHSTYIQFNSFSHILFRSNFFATRTFFWPKFMSILWKILHQNSFSRTFLPLL